MVTDGCPETLNKVHCKYLGRIFCKDCCDYPRKCQDCKHNKYEIWYDGVRIDGGISYYEKGSGC